MLFDSHSNSAIALPNRIAMAPMTRCRADHRDAVPNDMIVEYYRQRASAGLIISEGVPVSDRARGYINTPALWNDAQAAGLRRVSDAVHSADGSLVWTSPLPWLYQNVFAGIGSDPRFGSFVFACANLAAYAAVEFWLDRRRIYIRV